MVIARRINEHFNRAKYEEGREAMATEIREWLDRRDTATKAGEAFDEPMPTASHKNRESE